MYQSICPVLSLVHIPSFLQTLSLLLGKRFVLPFARFKLLSRTIPSHTRWRHLQWLSTSHIDQQWLDVTDRPDENKNIDILHTQSRTDENVSKWNVNRKWKSDQWHRCPLNHIQCDVSFFSLLFFYRWWCTWTLISLFSSFASIFIHVLFTSTSETKIHFHVKICLS